MCPPPHPNLFPSTDPPPTSPRSSRQYCAGTALNQQPITPTTSTTTITITTTTTTTTTTIPLTPYICLLQTHKQRAVCFSQLRQQQAANDSYDGADYHGNRGLSNQAVKRQQAASATIKMYKALPNLPQFLVQSSARPAEEIIRAAFVLTLCVYFRCCTWGVTPGRKRSKRGSELRPRASATSTSAARSDAAQRAIGVTTDPLPVLFLSHSTPRLP
ncbi:hypothetical protein C0Q70_07090 [Pomacea canaliculata]|uniref:Uncharacterized protein n=1 Tax=Pomacea canaliculata TaxID=400727 RepID=A0A2T7PE27_POMCA|nr:hypothetical protein C0Q70_07090 [Pomacea canaliculata]